MIDYIELLKAFLIEEKGYTVEKSNQMINDNTGIVMNGIMSGNISLRATAMALEMAESEKE